MGSLLGDWPSYDPHNFSQLRPSDPSKMSPATYHPTHNRTLPPPDQVITTEAKNILLRNFYERAEEKLRQKRAASEHLMPEHGCKQPLRHIKLAVPIQKRTRLSISPASTTAIQVDGPSASSKASKTLPFRVGHGFDLHRLEPGYPLIIGGIDVPRDRGCEAHSDGDVLLHCVVDAVLGALGLPDIGQIFPDSDPTWKGAPSSVFIKEAVRPTHDAGYEIGNLDATLILQRPKLSPHKEAIRANLSELLGADPSVVNLKAKTHEKVDSLGENRSIAAHTVVLLMKK